MPIVAFEDVTVVPMDSERRLTHQTLLVDGNRIAWIKPASEASLPAGAHRIQGRGKYVMPGLADMHCHPVSESDLLLFVAHGVTTVRNLEGLPRHLSWRQRIGCGELMGPAICTTGPIVGGRPSRLLWSISVSTRAEALRAVAAIKWAGYDAVKVYDDLSREAYRWVLDAAARFGLPVWGHVPWTVGFRDAVRAGQRSIEHQYGFLEALVPPAEAPADMASSRSIVSRHADSLPEEGFQELAELARLHGAWSCPTAVLDKRRTQSIREIVEGPGARFLPPGTAEALRRGRQSLPADYSAHRVWPLYLKAIKATHDAGAGLIAGTDAGEPGVLAGQSLHDELQVFTEAGLTPFQALCAATRDAARFLGQEGQWGVVREGARADLVLLDADPLADVANATKIAGAMLAGQWHPAHELQGGLDQLASQVAEPGARRRKPAFSTRNIIAEPMAQTRRYETEQAGFIVAVEEVTISVDPVGGNVLRSRASIQSNMFGLESGTYRCEVRSDADGVDQSARFDYDGLDGSERLLLTKDGDTVRIHRWDSWSGECTGVTETLSNALLSRTHGLLLVQVCRHLEGLEVGASRTLHIVGPGLPPAAQVYPGEARVERLADPRQARLAEASYRFELQFPNFGARGTLSVDRGGWPIEIALIGTRTTPNEALSQKITVVNDGALYPQPPRPCHASGMLRSPR